MLANNCRRVARIGLRKVAKDDYRAEKYEAEYRHYRNGVWD
jgi:hypothetical protein